MYASGSLASCEVGSTNTQAIFHFPGADVFCGIPVYETTTGINIVGANQPNSVVPEIWDNKVTTIFFAYGVHALPISWIQSELKFQIFIWD